MNFVFFFNTLQYASPSDLDFVSLVSISGQVCADVAVRQNFFFIPNIIITLYEVVVFSIKECCYSYLLSMVEGCVRV
jgi:hypothetical protein